MQAGEKNLEKVFTSYQRNIIPLFQRPYVWNAADNWAPLWEDIRAATDETEAAATNAVLSADHRTYFLGAIVLQARDKHPNNLHHVNVIDGQQRLTTLQVVFAAARNVARDRGYEFQAERFESLLFNSPVQVHPKFPEDRYKLWPLPLDREAFKWVVENTDSSSSSRPMHRLTTALDWFVQEIELWLTEAIDPEESLGYLFVTLKDRMQLVQIDLDKGDDPQIIFEVLNHRGMQLDAADLVKNLLFQQLEKTGKSADAESLLHHYWMPLDGQDWRRQVTTGRVKRTRADVLLGYWLAAQSKEEVSVEDLYNDFKTALKKLDLTPEETIKSIRSYADTLDSLEHSSLNAIEGRLIDRMVATQTNTPWPLLLWAFSTESVPPDQKVLIVRTMDSYLMRRGICRLTSQGYNRLFLTALVEVVKGDPSRAGEILTAFLQRQDADTTRWPDDSEFRKALLADNFFWSVLRARTRSLLLGIDNWLNDGKTLLPLSSAHDNQLNVEHVMPQDWEANWPLAAGLTEEERERQTLARNLAVQRLGNLTIVRGKHNSSLSNSSWPVKRASLMKYSPMAITSFTVTGEVELSNGSQGPANWNEDRIEERGIWLADLAVKIWPRGSDNG